MKRVCVCLFTVIQDHLQGQTGPGEVSVGGGGCDVGVYGDTHAHIQTPCRYKKGLEQALCWLISNSNTAPNREVVFLDEKQASNLCVLCLDLESSTSREQ